MAATPQTCTLIFIGESTKETYEIDGYISDVAGALVRFDGGAGASATSPDGIQFNERVTLRDISVVTGTADTTKIRLIAGNKPLQNVVRYAIHLTTLSQRPPMNIGFEKNTRIGAIQMA